MSKKTRCFLTVIYEKKQSYCRNFQIRYQISVRAIQMILDKNTEVPCPI